jgi:hypothetical protein
MSCRECCATTELLRAIPRGACWLLDVVVGGVRMVWCMVYEGVWYILTCSSSSGCRPPMKCRSLAPAVRLELGLEIRRCSFLFIGKYGSVSRIRYVQELSAISSLTVPAKIIQSKPCKMQSAKDQTMNHDHGVLTTTITAADHHSPRPHMIQYNEKGISSSTRKESNS